MTKYRAREIVEAVRWFPGTKIIGLTQVDADTAVLDNLMLVSSLSTGLLRNDFSTVNYGDYVITYQDGHRAAWRPDYFEEMYENIAG